MSTLITAYGAASASIGILAFTRHLTDPLYPGDRISLRWLLVLLSAVRTALLWPLYSALYLIRAGFAIASGRYDLAP